MKIKLDFKIILLYAIVVGLAVFGCIMVYSASSYSAAHNFDNEFHFLTKQIVGVVLGIFAMLFFSFVNYEKLKKFKWWLVLGTVILLILVFIPVIGVENYGAKRWINLGIFTLQPSEIAKFALVIFAAAHLSDNYTSVKKFKTLLPVLSVGMIFCLLVIIEPNMSITMCLGLIMLFMLFIGGASFKHFALLSMPAAAMVPVLIFIEPYRINRLMAFINPWASPQGEGYQLIQSLYSLGSGGLFGVGLFNSRQKFLFLPFSESDFIFSIIGEETGFFGATILIIVFASLVALLIKMAKESKNRYGCFLVSGIASVIAIQVIINIAVVTGSIPPTGIPLPFISAGSTSIIVFMAAIGIAVNVYRQGKTGVVALKTKSKFINDWIC